MVLVLVQLGVLVLVQLGVAAAAVVWSTDPLCLTNGIYYARS